ncbi:O-antigen ligase family protein [bacterium]|nr:O-antigen ligase family protein [bacterium]
MSVSQESQEKRSPAGRLAVLTSPKAEQWTLRGIGWALAGLIVISTFENNVRAGRVLLMAATIGLGVWAIRCGWVSLKRLRAVQWPVIALTVCILAASGLSIDVGYSFSTFFEQHFWFLILFAIVASWATDSERQMTILRGFLVAAGISAIGGIVLFYAGAEDFVKVSFTPDGAEMLRAEGMLESYTRSAMVFILALPATVAVGLNAFRNRKRAWLVAAIVVCVVSLWFLVLTRSRGPWVATAISTVLAIVFLRGRWWMLVAIAGLAAVFVLASPLGRARAATLVEDIGQPDRLLSGRIGLWQQGLDRIGVHPVLGLGYGGDIFTTHAGIEKYELVTDNREPDLHQIYLQTMAEIGLAGFAAYAWLVGTLLWLGIGALKHDAMPGTRVALAVLIAFLIYGLVACFNEGQVALLLWTMAGMLVVETKEATAA